MSRFNKGPKDEPAVDLDLWGLGDTHSSFQSPLPEDPPLPRSSFLELPSDEPDWLAEHIRPEPSPSRFRLPHIELPHIGIKVGPHFPRLFRRDRTKYERPAPTRPESLWDDPPPWDTSRPRSIIGLSDDDIDPWGDSSAERLARIGKERREAEAERGRKGKRIKVGAGIAAATTVVAGLGAKTTLSDAETHQRPPAATAEPFPKDKPKQHSSKTKFEIQLDKIPSKEDLGEVLDTPIRTQAVIQREEKGDSWDWDPKPGETSGLIDDYNPNFVGAYKSTQGIAINVYVAGIEGQEVTEEYEIHPETIQYILDNIEYFMPYAPENTAKKNILKHLKELKSGKIDGVLELVLRSGPEATCLDAGMEIIRYIEKDCKAGGVTQIAGFNSWERGGYGGYPISADIPIILSSGVKRQFKRSPSEDGKSYEVDYDETELVGDSKWQSGEGVGHEVLHALENNVEGGDNSHTEANDEGHEITKWFIGPDGMDMLHPNNYDFAGATTKSPKLADKIAKLIEEGKLQPIITKIPR